MQGHECWQAFVEQCSLIHGRANASQWSYSPCNAQDTEGTSTRGVIFHSLLFQWIRWLTLEGPLIWQPNICIRMLYSLSKQWSWPDMDGVELFVHLLLNLTVTATSIIWRVKTNYLLTLAVIYWNNPAGLISDWISVAVNLSAFHTVTATKRVFYCSCVSYHNR